MRIRNLSLLLLFLTLAAVIGCSRKADTSKPVDQIKIEAEKMSLNDLQSQAKAYVDAIAAKKNDLNKVAEQMKQLKPTELFGDKAKSIKDHLAGIQGEVSALTERYQVYAEKFKEKGGNLESIKLG